jgi:hypothetical protein
MVDANWLQIGTNPDAVVDAYPCGQFIRQGCVGFLSKLVVRLHFLGFRFLLGRKGVADVQVVVVDGIVEEGFNGDGHIRRKQMLF